MTLLIGIVARSRKPHVVLTADGRCTGVDGVTRFVSSDSYQKIFRIPDIPAVIAHHGQNIIAGRSVREFLDSFLDEQTDLSLATIEQLADALTCHTNKHAETTLQKIQASKLIGFWIAGFGHSRSQPELYEVCWKKDEASGEITAEKIAKGNLVFGGNAHRFVSQYCTDPVDGMYSWPRIPKQNINYAIKFHAKLYGIAEAIQAESPEELFGGHKHQIAITRDGCSWSVRETGGASAPKGGEHVSHEHPIPSRLAIDSGRLEANSSA